jgi:ubiquinone/menaquinone biosynthesis C-methylase UbiE
LDYINKSWARQTDYRPIAPAFDRRYEVHDYSGVETALGIFLASEKRIDVLDCGCGTGHWLHGFASPDRRLVGLDASAEMLMQADRGNQ